MVSFGGMQHSDPGRRANAGNFRERLFQEVGGDRHPISRGGARVAERSEVLADRFTREKPGRWFIETHADKRALGLRGASRRRRHATAGDARTHDAPSLKVDPYGEHNGRNVLVEAFGHFKSAIVLTWRKPRSLDREDELARLAVLLAVGDEEVFQREDTGTGALAQDNPAPKRDQSRRQVADRRAVGDVSADRSAHPHLL